MSRLFLIIPLIFSLQANAVSTLIHPTDTIPTLTKAEYKKLGRNQTTTAIVLVSVGGAAAILGLTGIAEYSAFNSYLIDGEKMTVPAGYYVAAVLGTLMALISIPVFKSAKENRRLSKQATVGLNMEKLNSIPTASMTKNYFPSLRFTVRF